MKIKDVLQCLLKMYEGRKGPKARVQIINRLLLNYEPINQLEYE